MKEKSRVIFAAWRLSCDSVIFPRHSPRWKCFNWDSFVIFEMISAWHQQHLTQIISELRSLMASLVVVKHAGFDACSRKLHAIYTMLICLFVYKAMCFWCFVYNFSTAKELVVDMVSRQCVKQFSMTLKNEKRVKKKRREKFPSDKVKWVFISLCRLQSFTSFLILCDFSTQISLKIYSCVDD